MEQFCRMEDGLLVTHQTRNTRFVWEKDSILHWAFFSEGIRRCLDSTIKRNVLSIVAVYEFGGRTYSTLLWNQNSCLVHEKREKFALVDALTHSKLHLSKSLHEI